MITLRTLLRALILGLFFWLGMRELALHSAHSVDAQWKYMKMQQAETLHSLRRHRDPGLERE